MDFTAIISTCKFGQTTVKEANSMINQKILDILDYHFKETDSIDETLLLNKLKEYFEIN